MIAQMKVRMFLSLGLASVSAVAVDAQSVIATGHTDIGIGYEGGAWDLHVHKELPEPEEEFEPGDAVLQVKLGARTVIPDNPALSFLGTAGDTVWVLPKDADPNQLLFLGIGTEELDPADWTGPLTLHLRAVQGPGEFFIWDVDSLGQPVVLMNSRDGVSAVDQLSVQAGSHGHYNYGFTTPGTYRVTVAASGTRKDTGFSTSSDATYTFRVEPAVLTTEHVDIKVVYQPDNSTNLLAIYVNDGDHGVRYRGDEAVMVVGEAAEISLPAGTPLGPEGATLWILPASQNGELLYLGLSAEGLAPGIFSGNLDFRLKAVEGPGHFILYQADLGGLNLRMDSRDGIDDRDRTDLIVGSHEHRNWAFTTNGIYRLTFQAAGRRVGESTNIVGADTTLVFHVLPLPPELPDLDPTPAQLAVRRMANGDLELDLTGTPGARYAVEIGSDLNQWSPFQTVQLTGGTASLALPNTGTARFFRATAR